MPFICFQITKHILPYLRFHCYCHLPTKYIKVTKFIYILIMYVCLYYIFLKSLFSFLLHHLLFLLVLIFPILPRLSGRDRLSDKTAYFVPYCIVFLICWFLFWCNKVYLYLYLYLYLYVLGSTYISVNYASVKSNLSYK